MLLPDRDLGGTVHLVSQRQVPLPAAFPLDEETHEIGGVLDWRRTAVRYESLNASPVPLVRFENQTLLLEPRIGLDILPVHGDFVLDEPKGFFPDLQLK